MPVGNPLYTDFEPIADDNQASPPVGAPEGKYAGKHVNDTFRFVMAVIRKLGDGVLQLDGSTKPTADIDWNQKKITNLLAGTARLHVPNVGQIQDGTATWGGTTGGAADAYTIALSPILSVDYPSGIKVRAVIHATNLTTTPTLKANDQVFQVIKYRDGSALKAGALQAGHYYEFVDDGASWRALDAGGYMEQALYDTLWPVNGPMQIRHDDVDPNTQLPGGITATWTELNLDEATATALALRDSAAVGITEGSDVSGGHALTVDELALHGHPARYDAQTNADSDGVGGIMLNADSDANHAAFNGTPTQTRGEQIGGTGGGQAHTHPNNNRVLIVRAWRRTV